MNDKTIYDAFQAFDGISQAVIFTQNEHALLFALLRTWNAARRPAVIEQWASSTCARTGLDKNSLPRARNGLVQKGVIYFKKTGQRGVPKYSLNALFEIDSPFLRLNTCSKTRVKPEYDESKTRVKRDSYQGKEKEKGEVKEKSHPPNFEAHEKPVPKPKPKTEANPALAKAKENLNKVFPNASASYTYAEEVAVLNSLKVIESLTQDDWLFVYLYFNKTTDWERTIDQHAKTPTKWRPRNRAHFIELIGETIENIRVWRDAKGRKWWTKKQQPKPNKPQKKEAPKADLSEYTEDVEVYLTKTGLKVAKEDIFNSPEEWEKFMRWMVNYSLNGEE